MTEVLIKIGIGYIIVGYIMLAMCEWNSHVMKTNMTTSTKWAIIFGWLPFTINYFIKK